MLELADIVRRHAPAYLGRFGARVPHAHRAALRAIARCRTPENGGQLYRCTQCAAEHFGFHSCHHRACPKCGQPEAQKWLDCQRERLLPVPYFLVTFTVPEALRAPFRSHQQLCYKLFFAASAGALADVAAQPRLLGAKLGFSGVLHTWTRQLVYHPHIHFIVPGGGLRTSDEKKWRKCRTTKAGEPFLLPVQVLSRRLRERFKASLQAEDPTLLATLPADLWRCEWVVHSQPAGSGHEALGYLARYVSRTALSNARACSRMMARTSPSPTPRARLDSTRPAGSRPRRSSGACSNTFCPRASSACATSAGCIRAPEAASCRCRRSCAFRSS